VGKKALQMVSAWASENGVVLGQRKVEGQSSKITAMPEPLDVLGIARSMARVQTERQAGGQAMVKRRYISWLLSDGQKAKPTGAQKKYLTRRYLNLTARLGVISASS
jgi:hypothetical protein